MDKKPCGNKSRQDSGGQWNVTFNTTQEVVGQLETMITAYNTGQATQGGALNTWFEVWSPNNNKAFFVIAQPPQVLPMPSFEQNALQTIQLTFILQDYKGQSTAIEPS